MSEFEFQYRWEEIQRDGINNSVEKLEARDQALEEHLKGGYGESCNLTFEYPYRWQQIVEQDHETQKAMLEHNMTALEDAIKDDGGCTLEFPYRWEQIMQALVEGDPHAFVMLEENDLTIEERFATCSCGKGPTRVTVAALHSLLGEDVDSEVYSVLDDISDITFSISDLWIVAYDGGGQIKLMVDSGSGYVTKSTITIADPPATPPNYGYFKTVSQTVVGTIPAGSSVIFRATGGVKGITPDRTCQIEGTSSSGGTSGLNWVRNEGSINTFNLATTDPNPDSNCLVTVPYVLPGPITGLVLTGATLSAVSDPAEGRAYLQYFNGSIWQDWITITFPFDLTDQQIRFASNPGSNLGAGIPIRFRTEWNGVHLELRYNEAGTTNLEWIPSFVAVQTDFADIGPSEDTTSGTTNRTGGFDYGWMSVTVQNLLTPGAVKLQYSQFGTVWTDIGTTSFSPGVTVQSMYVNAAGTLNPNIGYFRFETDGSFSALGVTGFFWWDSNGSSSGTVVTWP